MSLSSDISVVALIISLIALFIALLQLSQSLALTAEGYRRCAESVLGVWHKLRHRHFRWSELRFEVQYVTPQLLIVSENEFNLADENQEIYRLTSNSMVNSPDCPELEHTVHVGLKAMSQSRKAAKQNVRGDPGKTRGDDALQSKSISESTRTSNGNQEADAEKGEPQEPSTTSGNRVIAEPLKVLANIVYTRPTVRQALQIFNPMPVSMTRRWQRRQRARANELLVSWLDLLEELHAVYYSYCPQNCAKCRDAEVYTGWTKADVTHEKSNCPLVRAATKRIKNFNVDDVKEAVGSNTNRTDAAVIYRQWTWDFMPPDMVRPLAQVALGDLVILARRMDMQWRELDLKNGFLQAEGNGYSLTSTRVQGLGFVLKFTSTGGNRTKRFPRIIPSKAGDKLMCGMIPGDSDLVQRDFETVRPDGRVALPHVRGGILSQIGVPESRRREIEEKGYIEPENEFLMLLCPFLPLKHSNIVCYNIFGFRPNAPVRKSTFHFWEGRWALYQRLGSRLDEMSGSSIYADLKKVHNMFADLEENYRADFYCRYDHADLLHAAAKEREEEDTAVAKEDLIERCREYFDCTTEYLKGPGRELHRRDRHDQTRYLYLLAAHTCMAHKCIWDVDESVKRLSKEDRQHDKLREKYGFKKGHHGDWVDVWAVELGKRYIDYVRHPDHGIRKFLLDKRIDFSNDEIEAMWWHLMLRGIVWDMGSWANPDPGEPIPAAFYGDKTPVWIT